MGEKEFAALQREWFRQLTTCGASQRPDSPPPGGAGRLAARQGLAPGRRRDRRGRLRVSPDRARSGGLGRLLLGAQLLAGAGVAHAIVQSYLFPFAASALAVSAVLSVASVLPYVHGRPLRWLVVWSMLSSLAIASLPRLSTLGDAVPSAAQQVIAMAALPAATILTSLLLLQFSERMRYAQNAEAAARFDAEQTRHALETASQRLQIALSAAGIGIWDVGPRNGQRWSSTIVAASILGIPRWRELDYRGFLELVHADDRERIHHTASHARRRRGLRQRTRSNTACSVLTTLPERWIRSTGQRLVDGSQSSD